MLVGGNGISIGNAENDGVYVNHAVNTGFKVGRVDINGLNVYRSDGDGVLVDSAANVGFYVNRCDTGVVVMNAVN
ncbi:MAG: hypothetical protein ONB05_11120, partial [candidate division KSB1 bacterium]|nr:hypothetical protein [candidate division KSB1 bacterium]